MNPETTAVSRTAGLAGKYLTFALADEEALLELRERLKNANCEVTDVVDHGFIRSIYFTDPNGIALEASWWTYDPTGHGELLASEDRQPRTPGATR